MITPAPPKHNPVDPLLAAIATARTYERLAVTDSDCKHWRDQIVAYQKGVEAIKAAEALRVRIASEELPPDAYSVLAWNGETWVEAWCDVRGDRRWRPHRDGAIVSGYVDRVTHWFPRPALPEKNKL